MFKTKTLALLPILLGAALAAYATPRAQDHDHDHGDEHADGHEAEHGPAGDPYLLDTDPVSGKKLGPAKDLILVRHEGRELRFSSKETLAKFRSDPAPYLAQVDAKLVKQQLPYYPLETCPISGEPLDGMGEPLNVVYKNRLVRLCCKGCVKKFHGAAADVLGKLDKAVIAAQGPGYALQTCPVSGDELGGMGEVIEVVVGNRLVRLCCKGCKKELAADPLPVLAALGGAAKAEGDGHGGHEHGDHDH